MYLERLVCACALVCAASVFAQTREWENEFDEQTKGWQEIQAQIPAYPKPENLIALDVGRASPHHFYIDSASVMVGQDGVVRYTALVKTAGGATNVTFEGIRCETREQKLYAVGHSNGTWVRARDPKWQRIELQELAPHRYTLYRDYFCADRTRAAGARQVLDALRRGVPLSARLHVD